MLAGKRVTLLVSGSIAAYKAAELIRALKRLGAEVRVAMSKSATEFISPLTLQTLAGTAVRLDLFDEVQEAAIGHIALADEADVVVVAPATANCMAKAAHGIADDLLSTVLLAATAPVVCAPAMNVNMWRHPATQANVALLRSRGMLVLDPGEGELACGWTGAGRFPELSEIVEAISRSVQEQDLIGCTVVVTAGPTQEAIDPVRYISNRSSGRMGYAIAQQAMRRGAEVHLISGPTALARPAGVHFQKVETAAQMRDAVFGLLERPPLAPCRYLVFMAAAVSDHRPSGYSATKLKNDKTTGHELALEPNPDILQELGEVRDALRQNNACSIALIGFAAETAQTDEELIQLTREKLLRKKADILVGNYAEAMGKSTNRVWLLDRRGRQEEFATASKEHIAERIITAALKVS